MTAAVGRREACGPPLEKGHLSGVARGWYGLLRPSASPAGAGRRRCASDAPGEDRGRCRALWPWGGAAERLARALGLRSYITIAGLGSPHSSTPRPPALEEKGERNKKGGGRKIPVRSFQ